MSTWQLLATAWNLEPSVLVGCAALLAGYLWLARGARSRPSRVALFGGGVVCLLLALVSPIDVLGDEYLFSAHMAQHLLLVLVVPPLLLLGLPEESLRRALRVRAVLGVASAVGRPGLAWVLAAGTLWVWHLPPLYNAALADERLHIVQHLTFLVTSTAFWWPILSPLEERRMGAGAAMAYLFSAGMASVILGIILTFAPAGLYAAYLQPHDSLGFLSLIRQGWGLSASGDQQLGGLLMWVPGGLVYLLAIFGVFARWQAGDAEDVIETPERANTSLPESPGEAVPALSRAGAAGQEEIGC